MRTSLYINSIYLDRLEDACSVLDITWHEIIAVLLSRVAERSEFEARPARTIQYQDSNPSVVWVTEPVTFKPVVFEKIQDLKRHSKYSVSWFVAFAVVTYLDEIIEEMTNPRKSIYELYNYESNFSFFAKPIGGIQAYITIWGIPKVEYLDELLL